MREPIGRFVEVERVDAAQRSRAEWWAYSTRSGLALGRIFWFARWRCYAWQQEPCTVLNAECLVDLAAFLNRNRGTRSEAWKES